ncbi:hypothetical protein [Paenibacillus sp. UMB7766-LJ446]|uniref:hypothetical protein n=1 Tax=Paenibacillus sp. UMB7766-LJ446 TaxID=3046313 RepID=UPI00254CAEB2|nr:hypothetical protein [Paenibacillus sp. UMB7766-LJ446]
MRRLGEYKINAIAINLLDSWLAIQRKAVLRNLSPVRFSNQSDIDIELAIDMFSLSSSPEIGVLKPIFKSICPCCDSQNGQYASMGEVPDELISCKHCSFEYVPFRRPDYIEIVFERCLDPETPISSGDTRETFQISGGNRGKVDSLRVSDVLKTKSVARRQLLSNLDGRYEAAQ